MGKTMIAKNLAHQAILRGFTARFTTASDMLHDLAAQDSDASLARRLRRYTQPQLLAVDEVGYTDCGIVGRVENDSLGSDHFGGLRLLLHH